MNKTSQQFKTIVAHCKELYSKKLKDYGTAWRILRPSSLTDQIFIKAQRIRTIQIKQTQKIDEDQESEFIGILNYSVIALIQMEHGLVDQPDMSSQNALIEYEKYIHIAFDLMNNKNHDYGEAWRDMRISSITDLILQKIHRIKQIEDNLGNTLVSEGLDANYLDIVNYSIFALILIKENEKSS